MPKTGRAIGFRAGGVAWRGAQNSCHDARWPTRIVFLFTRPTSRKSPRSTATLSRREPLQGGNSPLPESCVGFLSLRKVLKSLTDVNFLSRISGGAKGKSGNRILLYCPQSDAWPQLWKNGGTLLSRMFKPSSKIKISIMATFLRKRRRQVCLG
jgi:hypothetical protein